MGELIELDALDRYNAENQYQQYLKLVGLKEEELTTIQNREMRRAFFGGLGQMFMLINHSARENPEEAAEKLGMMRDQINDFWRKEEEEAGQRMLDRESGNE